MGFFQRLKEFWSGPKYCINREILLEYGKNVMQFSVEHDLCACDEFFLSADGKAWERIFIINYDAACVTPSEAEEGLSGFRIYVTNGSFYDPEKSKRYYTIESLIDFHLANYPQQFYLHHKLCSPVELEKYKI